MTRIRLQPDDRKQQLMEAALVLANKYGIKALTRVAIAAETGTTDGLVNRYFGNRAKMRAEVIAEAVKRKHVRTVAWALTQGFAIKDAPRQLMRDAGKVVLY